MLYYKIDSRRVSFAEYWRITNGKLMSFLVAACSKLIGARLNFKTATPRFESLIRVEPEQIPPQIKDVLAEQIEKARQLGSQFQFIYQIPMLSRAEGYGVAFLSEDGQSLPQILYSRIEVLGRVRVTKSFSCVSKLSDNTLVATSDQSRKFSPPPWLDGLALPGADFSTVLRRHLERLKSRSGASPVTITPDSVEKLIVELNVRDIDHKIERGVYVPMTDAEVEALRKIVNT